MEKTRAGYLVILLGLVATLVLSLLLVFVEINGNPECRSTGLGLLGLGDIVGSERILHIADKNGKEVTVDISDVPVNSIGGLIELEIFVSDLFEPNGSKQGGIIRITDKNSNEHSYLLGESKLTSVNGQMKIVYDDYDFTEYKITDLEIKAIRSNFFRYVMHMGVIFGIVYGVFVINNIIAIVLSLLGLVKTNNSKSKMKFIFFAVFYGIFVVLSVFVYIGIISTLVDPEIETYSTQYYFLLIPLALTLIAAIRTRKLHKEQSATATPEDTQ